AAGTAKGGRTRLSGHSTSDGSAPAGEPAVTSSWFEQQTKPDDAPGPDQSGENCQPVEVLLHDGGTAERGRDAAPEEVGQTPALAAVEQHEHDHQQAGQ